MDHEKRIAFLEGEGTLTVAECRRWAQEMRASAPVAFAGLPWLPPTPVDREPVMVSLVRPYPPDRRGLSGATIIGGAFG